MTPETQEGSTPASALILAITIVGAGLLTVCLLIYGLMLAQTQRMNGDLMTIGGLVAYLAVWAWGLMIAKNS